MSLATAVFGCLIHQNVGRMRESYNLTPAVVQAAYRKYTLIGKHYRIKFRLEGSFSSLKGNSQTLKDLSSNKSSNKVTLSKTHYHEPQKIVRDLGRGFGHLYAV